MERKYDVRLLEQIKDKQETGTWKNMEVLYKRVPDVDKHGAMDPRLYEDSKKMMRMLKFIPEKMIKMDTSGDGLANLRETFNGVKSVPVIETGVDTKEYQVTVQDGTKINVYRYTTSETQESAPVLYYIHGGGFFGGHHGVVEQSLKMMCEKFHFNIFSVDYRLAPENPYPIGHEDCYDVLKWMYANAEDLNINRDLIFVAGDSAGGNLTQYCSTRDREDGERKVKGQLLLYATLNMCGIEDKYYHWDLSEYSMIRSQRKALTKMLHMFGAMTSGMEDILKIKDANNDYLNPYTRKNPEDNPATFITAGEHDYLKVEALAYGAKLHDAGVEVKTVIYDGLGHAYFDNCGVYPQCEDCIEEMGHFIMKQSGLK